MTDVSITRFLRAMAISVSQTKPFRFRMMTMGFQTALHECCIGADNGPFGWMMVAEDYHYTFLHTYECLSCG